MKYKSISITESKKLKFGDIVTILADPISSAPDFTKLPTAKGCIIENVIETKWICVTGLLELNGVICIPEKQISPKYMLNSIDLLIQHWDLDPLLGKKISSLPKKILKSFADFSHGKWVSVFSIIRREDFEDGEYCCECENFFPMAVPNLKNEKMVCWRCRTSNGWKYSELYIG